MHENIFKLVKLKTKLPFQAPLIADIYINIFYDDCHRKTLREFWKNAIFYVRIFEEIENFLCKVNRSLLAIQSRLD